MVFSSHTFSPLGCLISGLTSSAIFLKRIKETQTEKEGRRQSLRDNEIKRARDSKEDGDGEKERQGPGGRGGRADETGSTSEEPPPALPSSPSDRQPRSLHISSE